MAKERAAMSIRTEFTSPDRKYGIYQIIHGEVAASPSSGADITGQGKPPPHSPGAADRRRDYFERCGFAGVVGNVPYGDGFPDDEYEWLATEAGIRGYIKRGMRVWLYDEKGYPSGTAGGVVVERNPEYIAKGLVCYEYWRTISGPCKYRADTPGDRLVCAMLLPIDGSEPKDVTHFLGSDGVLRLEVPPGNWHLFMMSERRLFDGTHAAESYSEPRNYISLSDRDAVKEFIAVTHEKYAKYLGDEFGRGIPAFFTDEPSLISWTIRHGVYPILPWHPSYPKEFEEKYGYSFFLAAAAVVTGRGPDVTKRRCDFWEFVADSVAEGFFGTIQDWCRAHNIKSSGHMLAEERLQSHVYSYGSMYKCACRMDWPGIDQLNTEPGALMNQDIIPIARLLASFADVYGEGEAFTEFSDHVTRMAGRVADKRWTYASVGWHIAQGINNFTSYYSFAGWAEDELRHLNLYTARCGQIMRHGKRASTTAVLYPEAAIWSAYTPSVAANAIDHSTQTLRIDQTFARTSWELLKQHVDFDYLDEDAILEGEIESGALRFRGRQYSCIVLPSANVLRRATVEKLAKASAAGVGVVCVGCYPDTAREDGGPINFTAYFERMPALCDIDEKYSPRGLFETGLIKRHITLTGQGAGMVLSHVRHEGSQTLVFLCNMADEPYEGELIAEGATAEIADPNTGEIAPTNAATCGSGITVPLKIEPLLSKIIIIER
ncbi:MAG TPA: glycosyl hydrolase [Bacillota bacterium]|nr:glycosyl hydrolase [Bacillota bacterium]